MTEIPEHLLKRAQEAREKAESSSGASEPAASGGGEAAAEPAATGPAPPEPAATAFAAETPDADPPALEGSLRAPWHWERFLVEAAVIGGQDRWERRLRGLEKELELKRDRVRAEEPEAPRHVSIERDLNNLKHLRRFALPLVGKTEAPAR